MSPQISVQREELSTRYLEIKLQNPLLARIETETAIIGWTDEETRTFQLLIACASNASLKKRVDELENMLRPSIVN